MPTSGSGTEMHSTCSDFVFDKRHILQVGMKSGNVLPQSCCQNGPLVSHKTAADSAGHAAPPDRANMISNPEGYTLGMAWDHPGLKQASLPEAMAMCIHHQQPPKPDEERWTPQFPIYP